MTGPQGNVTHSNEVSSRLTSIHHMLPKYPLFVSTHRIRFVQAEVNSFIFIQQDFCHSDITRHFAIFSCQYHRPLPWSGIRVGEAKNPGPALKHRNDSSYKIAIVNPTSVRNKQSEFSDLLNNHNCDLIALAETSATIETQKDFSFQVKKMGAKVLWSDPVAQQRTKLDGTACKRGKAGGTALITKLTARPSRHSTTPDWQVTTRLLHSIVQLGGTHVQFFVIYGATQSISNATSFTEKLIQEAIDRSKMLPLPAVFLGDFNMSVSDSESFEPLFKQGYQPLQAIHRRLLGSEMAFTCNEATSPDTAVIHPLLVPRVRHIEVLKSKLFDVHDPVIWTIDLPCEPLSLRRFNVPKTWSDFPITNEDLYQTWIDEFAHLEPAQDFHVWCQKVEQLVDATLRKQHQKDPILNPTKRLPWNYRGRGKIKSATQHPIQSRLKKGRHGDYEPDTEVHAIRTKRIITQFRRIQSLRRRVNKISLLSEIWPRTWTSLQQEWNCIVNDRSLGTLFALWAQENPAIGVLPFVTPTLQFLITLEEAMKPVVDEIVYQDGQIRQRLYAWDQHLDHTTHSKKAFATARGSSKPPLNRIATHFCDDGLLMDPPNWDDASESWIAEIAVGYPKKFDPLFPVKIESNDWWIQSTTQHSLKVTSKHKGFLPDDITVSQKREHFDHQTIFSELTGYWKQFWNRDPKDEDLTIDECENARRIFEAIPTDLPDIQVDMTDISIWSEVIKATNSLTAPGIDGIRAQELQLIPTDLLAELVSVVNSTETILPIELLQGRTLPIAKTWTIEEASSTRPITVLPLVYRIWGKVATVQIIRQLSSFLPKQISGFLKGRSAFQAAYNFQVWLEQTATLHQQRSGVTLDLIKCYNLIHRGTAADILTEFNIDPELVAQWSAATRNLHRFWEVDGVVSDTFATSTGCAEGDPIAVVVMILISACWIYNCPYQEQRIRMNAYADNWSWASTDPSDHPEIVEATTAICKMVRLKVDPNKTWIWASNPELAHSTFQAAEALCPGKASFKVVAGAKDLGLFMQYSGKANLGTLKDRIVEGHQRLHRIKMCQWPLKVKMHVITTSVYAAAFHGVEQVAIGQDVLARFRHQVAETVLGAKSHTMCPVLTFLGLPKLLDPAVFVIFQALKSARKWLIGASQEQKDTFLTIASRHRGIPGTSKGPAGALKTYLQRIDWSITPQGIVWVNPFCSLDLCLTSNRELLWWLKKSWQNQLLEMHTQRFSLFGFPAIEKEATTQCVQSFSDAEQKLILREISQAFQTNSQKAKWDEHEEGLCPYCQEKDSKPHRYLDCQAMSHIREQHPAACEILHECHPGWCNLPVIFRHPQHDLVHAIHYRMPTAIILDEIVQIIQQRALDQPPTFFTDGSSLHQASPESRFSACAIVADIATSNHDRKDQVNHFFATGQEPDSLIVVGTCRTPGLQGIHRAEILAIVLLCETFQAFDLYTDSQTAIGAFDSAHSASSHSDFWDHPEFDLIVRIFNVRKVTQKVHKIKAHVTFDLAHPWEQTYRSLGNKKANDAAIITAKESIPEIANELWQYHNDCDKAQQDLKCVYKYIVALCVARARADTHNHNISHQPQEQTSTDPLELLSAWNPPDFWCPPAQVQSQGLVESVWGWQAAAAAFQFLRSCKWPSQVHGPTIKPVGISWLEVALGIMYKMGTYLPIKRITADGDVRLVYLSSYDMAEAHKTTLSEQAETASLLMQHILTLVPERLVPHIPRGRVRSLYMLGETYMCTGWLWRPAFDDQRNIMQVAKRYIENGRILPDLHFTTKPQWQTDAKKMNLSWHERMSRAKTVQLAVREVRAKKAPSQ